MTIYLKKDTDSQRVPLGQFLSSTDGTTLMTGLTIESTDVYILKRGSTAADNPLSTATLEHVGQGIYTFLTLGADVDTYGQLVVYCKPTGALNARQECFVLPALVYDSWVAGTDNLQVDTIQISGTTQAARDIGTSVLVGDKTGFALTTAQHDLIGARAWTETTRSLTDKASFTLTAAYDAAKTAATAAEVAKIPKSDGAVTWNNTALASINTEVDTALNTAIPGAPTANSINERVAAMDDLTQASGSGDLATILAGTVESRDLLGRHSIIAPTYSTTGNLLTATILTTSKTYGVTATYSTDDNLATYAVTT